MASLLRGGSAEGRGGKKSATQKTQSTKPSNTSNLNSLPTTKKPAPSRPKGSRPQSPVYTPTKDRFAAYNALFAIQPRTKDQTENGDQSNDSNHTDDDIVTTQARNKQPGPKPKPKKPTTSSKSQFQDDNDDISLSAAADSQLDDDLSTHNPSQIKTTPRPTTQRPRPSILPPPHSPLRDQPLSKTPSHLLTKGLDFEDDFDPFSQDDFWDDDSSNNSNNINPMTNQDSSQQTNSQGVDQLTKDLHRQSQNALAIVHQFESTAAISTPLTPVPARPRQAPTQRQPQPQSPQHAIVEIDLTAETPIKPPAPQTVSSTQPPPQDERGVRTVHEQKSKYQHPLDKTIIELSSDDSDADSSSEDSESETSSSQDDSDGFDPDLWAALESELKFATMYYRLSADYGEGVSSSFIDVADTRVSIGRGDQCDLFIKLMSVSRHHADLIWNPDTSWLSIKNLSNQTTLVDGDQLTQGEERTLYHDSTFQISSQAFVVSYQSHLADQRRPPPGYLSQSQHSQQQDHQRPQPINSSQSTASTRLPSFDTNQDMNVLYGNVNFNNFDNGDSTTDTELGSCHNNDFCNDNDNDNDNLGRCVGVSGGGGGGVDEVVLSKSPLTKVHPRHSFQPNNNNNNARQFPRSTARRQTQFQPHPQQQPSFPQILSTLYQFEDVLPSLSAISTPPHSTPQTKLQSPPPQPQTTKQSPSSQSPPIIASPSHSTALSQLPAQQSTPIEPTVDTSQPNTAFLTQVITPMITTVQSIVDQIILPQLVPAPIPPEEETSLLIQVAPDLILDDQSDLLATTSPRRSTQNALTKTPFRSNLKSPTRSSPTRSPNSSFNAVTSSSQLHQPTTPASPTSTPLPSELSEAFPQYDPSLPTPLPIASSPSSSSLPHLAAQLASPSSPLNRPIVYSLLPPAIDMARPLHQQLSEQDKDAVISHLLQIIMNPTQLSSHEQQLRLQFISALQHLPLALPTTTITTTITVDSDHNIQGFENLEAMQHTEHILEPPTAASDSSSGKGVSTLSNSSHSELELSMADSADLPSSFEMTNSTTTTTTTLTTTTLMTTTTARTSMISDPNAPVVSVFEGLLALAELETSIVEFVNAQEPSEDADTSPDRTDGSFLTVKGHFETSLSSDQDDTNLPPDGDLTMNEDDSAPIQPIQPIPQNRSQSLRHSTSSVPERREREEEEQRYQRLLSLPLDAMGNLIMSDRINDRSALSLQLSTVFHPPQAHSKIRIELMDDDQSQPIEQITPRPTTPPISDYEPAPDPQGLTPNPSRRARFLFVPTPHSQRRLRSQHQLPTSDALSTMQSISSSSSYDLDTSAIQPISLSNSSNTATQSDLIHSVEPIIDPHKVSTPLRQPPGPTPQRKLTNKTPQYKLTATPLPSSFFKFPAFGFFSSSDEEDEQQSLLNDSIFSSPASPPNNLLSSGDMNDDEEEEEEEKPKVEEQLQSAPIEADSVANMTHSVDDLSIPNTDEQSRPILSTIASPRNEEQLQLQNTDTTTQPQPQPQPTPKQHRRSSIRNHGTPTSRHSFQPEAALIYQQLAGIAFCRTSLGHQDEVQSDEDTGDTADGQPDNSAAPQSPRDGDAEMSDKLHDTLSPPLNTSTSNEALVEKEIPPSTPTPTSTSLPQSGLLSADIEHTEDLTMTDTVSQQSPPKQDFVQVRRRRTSRASQLFNIPQFLTLPTLTNITPIEEGVQNESASENLFETGTSHQSTDPSAPPRDQGHDQDVHIDQADIVVDPLSCNTASIDALLNEMEEGTSEPPTAGQSVSKRQSTHRRSARRSNIAPVLNFQFETDPKDVAAPAQTNSSISDFQDFQPSDFALPTLTSDLRGCLSEYNKWKEMMSVKQKHSLFDEDSDDDSLSTDTSKSELNTVELSRNTATTFVQVAAPQFPKGNIFNIAEGNEEDEEAATEDDDFIPHIHIPQQSRRKSQLHQPSSQPHKSNATPMISSILNGKRPVTGQRTITALFTSSTQQPPLPTPQRSLSTNPQSTPHNLSRASSTFQHHSNRTPSATNTTTTKVRVSVQRPTGATGFKGTPARTSRLTSVMQNPNFNSPSVKSLSIFDRSLLPADQRRAASVIKSTNATTTMSSSTTTTTTRTSTMTTTMRTTSVNLTPLRQQPTVHLNTPSAIKSTPRVLSATVATVAANQKQTLSTPVKPVMTPQRILIVHQSPSMQPPARAALNAPPSLSKSIINHSTTTTTTKPVHSATPIKTNVVNRRDRFVADVFHRLYSPIARRTNTFDPIFNVDATPIKKHGPPPISSVPTPQRLQASSSSSSSSSLPNPKQLRPHTPAPKQPRSFLSTTPSRHLPQPTSSGTPIPSTRSQSHLQHTIMTRPGTPSLTQRKAAGLDHLYPKRTEHEPPVQIPRLNKNIVHNTITEFAPTSTVVCLVDAVLPHQQPNQQLTDTLKQRTSQFWLEQQRLVAMGKTKNLRPSEGNSLQEARRNDCVYVEQQFRHQNALYPQVPDFIEQYNYQANQLEKERRASKRRELLEISRTSSGPTLHNDVDDQQDDEEDNEVLPYLPDLSRITEKTEARSVRSRMKSITTPSDRRRESGTMSIASTDLDLLEDPLTTTTITTTTTTDVLTSQNTLRNGLNSQQSASYDDSLKTRSEYFFKSPLLSTLGQIQQQSHRTSFNPPSSSSTLASTHYSSASPIPIPIPTVADFQQSLRNSIVDAFLLTCAHEAHSKQNQLDEELSVIDNETSFNISTSSPVSSFSLKKDRLTTATALGGANHGTLLASPKSSFVAPKDQNPHSSQPTQPPHPSQQAQQTKPQKYAWQRRLTESPLSSDSEINHNPHASTAEFNSTRFLDEELDSILINDTVLADVQNTPQKKIDSTRVTSKPISPPPPIDGQSSETADIIRALSFEPSSPFKPISPGIPLRSNDSPIPAQAQHQPSECTVEQPTNLSLLDVSSLLDSTPKFTSRLAKATPKRQTSKQRQFSPIKPSNPPDLLQDSDHDDHNSTAAIDALLANIEFTVPSRIVNQFNNNDSSDDDLTLTPVSQTPVKATGLDDSHNITGINFSEISFLQSTGTVSHQPNTSTAQTEDDYDHLFSLSGILDMNTDKTTQPQPTSQHTVQAPPTQTPSKRPNPAAEEFDFFLIEEEFLKTSSQLMSSQTKSKVKRQRTTHSSSKKRDDDLELSLDFK